MQKQQIGIRELKNHLSQYLKQVKSGEGITISERGKAFAMILPIFPLPAQNNLNLQLLQLAQEGKVLLPEMSQRPILKYKRKKFPGSSFSDDIINSRR